MKNLLIYVNPRHGFDPETEVLAKIQIDNSFSQGWHREDILLFTNFDYEYNGVQAVRVPDECFCAVKPLGTKTTTVAYLLNHDLLKDELYWCHDFDAYQMNPISEYELNIKELGLTDYGWSRRWCMGCFFFRISCKDIFNWIDAYINLFELVDEKALLKLTRIDFKHINKRIQRLNVTYDFGMRNVLYNLRTVKKPIRILHFHPHHKEVDTLKIFLSLMSENLKDVFKYHGVL